MAANSVVLLSLLAANLQRIENLEKLVSELNSTCKCSTELQSRVEVLEKFMADFYSNAASPDRTTHITEKSTQSTTDVTVTPIKDLCPVSYEGRCFFAVFERADYEKGTEICGNFGGDLANIYSQTHMDDVMNYIRGEIDINFEDIRLGMTFDAKAYKMYYRDGSEAPPSLRWYPHAPFDADTSIVLGVHRISSSPLQYLDTQSRDGLFYFLCETGGEYEGSGMGHIESVPEQIDTATPNKAATARQMLVSIETEVGSKTSTTIAATTVRDLCPVSYEGRCFFAVFERADYEKGTEICGNFGGDLANIYSQTHMDDVMNYVRENFDINFEDIRLGMTFDAQAYKMYYRDGSEAPPTLRWYPHAPFDADTSIVLGVHRISSSPAQYLDTQSRDGLFYFLCETGS